jgi:cardiolipin synthase (CMP-forming)
MTWTIPNMLTIIRVLLVPCFVLFLFKEESGARLAALLVFSIAALTDYLDGRIARAYNQRSEFGNFADPLADKLLVSVALISLTFLPEAHIPLWAVLLILGREVLITWLRIHALRQQEVVETSFWGKGKTAAQMTTIILVLIMLIAQAFILESLGGDAPEALIAKDKFWECYAKGAAWGDAIEALPPTLILITCFLALYSGFRYIRANRNILYPAKRDKNQD